MSEHLAFLKAFSRNAGKIGAIAPSSSQLASRMLDWMDWDEIDTVVEYGSGTGVFTEAIAKRLKPETTFFAIERDPELAKITRTRCPDVTVKENCVTRVVELSKEEGADKVDAIVCGLPWASFPPQLQDKCLEAMFKVLPPGGQFSTFAYWQGLALPAGLRFRKFLKENFSSVEQSRTAWKNLPPAFVYQCRR